MMLLMVADASTKARVQLPVVPRRKGKPGTSCFGLAAVVCLGILPACAATRATGEPAELPQELVGFWRFDEGAGTTAADASRYGNDGVLLGAPPSVPGHIGGARLFDHVGAAVQVPPKAALHSSRALTITGWLYANSLAPTRTNRGWSWHTILTKGDASATATPGTTDHWEYSVFVTSAGALNGAVTTVDQVGKGPQYCPTADGTIQVGRWQHFGVVVDGDAALTQVFVDGVLAARCAVDRSGIRETAGPLTIGADEVGSEYRWEGLLDEIRVYNRPLREAELKALAGFSH